MKSKKTDRQKALELSKRVKILETKYRTIAILAEHILEVISAE